jgi:tRNA 2-thiouridine synthesizing protein A
MSTDDVVVALELDVRGHKCPIPMARLGTEIDGVGIGDVIKLVADDPACMLDVPAWCRITENELVSAEEVGDEYVLHVRRKR